MSVRNLVDRLERARVQVQPLERGTLWSLQQRWRETYSSELHARTGEWIRNEYDWHTFSFEYRACLVANRAAEEYKRLSSCGHLVLSSWSGQEFGFQCDGKPLDLRDLFIDANVVATDLSWSMSFTHERQHGPYFATTNERENRWR